MRSIWLSTLQSMQDNPKFSAAKLNDVVPSQAKSTRPSEDKLIKINVDQINLALDSLNYPSCASCKHPICGSSAARCQCSGNEKYQEQYLALRQEIEATEHAFNTFMATPFRQARNGFGFSSTIFGGISLFLTNAVQASFAVAMSALIIPPLVIGGYIYYRAKREDTAAAEELYATFFAKKVELMCLQQEIITLQYQDNRSCDLQDPLPHYTKPQKEKRNFLANSFGHFIAASLATLAMVQTVIKFGFLASLMVVSGPIGWGVAIGAGLIVGGYFAYKRYKHLSAKNRVDSQLATVATIKANLKAVKESLKNTSANTKKSSTHTIATMFDMDLVEKPAVVNAESISMLQHTKLFSANNSQENSNKNIITPQASTPAVAVTVTP